MCRAQCCCSDYDLKSHPITDYQPPVWFASFPGDESLVLARSLQLSALPQVSRLTSAPLCPRALCASSWSWWATTLCTWPSRRAATGSCSATPSGSLTRREASATSCSSSWTRRCLQALSRTRSCGRAEEEVTEERNDAFSSDGCFFTSCSNTCYYYVMTLFC